MIPRNKIDEALFEMELERAFEASPMGEIISVAVDGEYGKAHILLLSFPCLEVGAVEKDDVLLNERTMQVVRALTPLTWDKKVAVISISKRPQILKVQQGDKFIRIGEGLKKSLGEMFPK